MMDSTNKLLKLINDEKGLEEIISELGISRDEVYRLFRELKMIGMDFKKKFYANGDIVYLPKKELDIPNNSNSVSIITTPNSDSFRALIISDLHIGSIYERKDVWDLIINYCINNGIHTVIICGDFLDGINIGRSDCKLSMNPMEQIEHAVSSYPVVSGITNFVTFGNHDIDLLTSFGIDFFTYLLNYRHDIVPVGYGYGRINIKNDKIFITHPLRIGVNKNIDLTGNYLLLKGHQHTTKSIIGANGNCSMVVPSLSNIFLNENDFLPGAIDLTIKFKHGYFDTIYYEHLLINKKISKVSSTQFSITHPKDRKFDGSIKYEDERAGIKRVLKK